MIEVRPGISIIGPKPRQLYVTQIHQFVCQIFAPLNKKATMTAGMSRRMQHLNGDITQIKNMSLVERLYFAPFRVVKRRFDLLPEFIVFRARRCPINFHQAFNTFQS